MSAVSASAPPKKRATIEELMVRLEENEHLEIIDGEIVEQAGSVPASIDNEASGPRHSRAMTRLGLAIGPFDRKPGSPGELGGWWVFTDLHVGYPGGEVYEHDLCGFRRDRHPECPTRFPTPACLSAWRVRRGRRRWQRCVP